ncbi:retrovirus-related Pol polyprotein from transposon 17.6 [Nephila pilipes]|uniref:Retrovirus-related Pol polyprotein from transposon 17.6 n=1 Tax=Nephila pilipes TaxID=299642 RepID=A0A8X6MR15_NEPPI|nr:retrovirus-related Pol polyprotein from transposon 17.6 [Nephila pilipes]
MRFTLLLPGKLIAGGVVAMFSSPGITSCCLFIRNKNTFMSSLIDSGSDISIILANRKELKLPVLQTFRAANCTQINLSKLLAQGIEPLSDRVKCILEIPQPTTLTQLRHCLGLFNFYRFCISKDADILKSLAKFFEGLKNKKKHPRFNVRNSTEQLERNDDANLSFKASKNAPVNTTLLRHPIPVAELSLWVDESNVAVDDFLKQLSNSQWELIAFYFNPN